MTKFTYNGQDDDDEIDKIIKEHKAKILERGPIVEQMEKADAEAYANSQVKKDLDDVKNELGKLYAGKTLEQLQQEEYDYYQQEANRLGEPQTVLVDAETKEEMIFYPQSNSKSISSEYQQELDEDTAWIFEKPKAKE